MQSNMKELIREFMNQRNWALVGASENPTKYGNRMFSSLLKAGYVVYPVNPNATEIDGHKVYSTLREFPEVADIVVPPNVTEQIVREYG